MLTAGDGSAGGGCGSTGAPCCPGALSGSKWGVAESLSSYQGAGMKLAGGCEETTEALCRARGSGSAEDEDKPMGQAAGGSSCSSGQEAWTPSADHALAGDNHKQLMRQGKSLACRWQAAAARHEEAAAVATPKRLPPSPLAKKWVAAVAKRRLGRSRPIVRVLLEAMSDHQLL